MTSATILDFFKRLRRQFGDASPSASSPSIFAEANIVTAKEHCHVLQTTGTTPMPHLAASYYSVHLDEAYFTLANSLGNVFIVKMGNLKVGNARVIKLANSCHDSPAEN